MTNRTMLCVSVAVGALVCASGPVMARTTGAAQTAAQEPAGGALSEVVVTGSRIVRDGYQAPTPLTVVTGDAIRQNSATANISSYLNTIPAIAGSLQPQGNLNSTNSGNTRVNALSLRNLGPNRTLLLVDGQRVVSSTQGGASDLNSIPQQLVSRVDIVTGGASAVYGSDAVAGVVNIILDHKFTGIKLDVSGNVTNYSDNKGANVQFSAGNAFAGGRGHAIFSAEYNQQAGIDGDGGRKWNRNSVMVLNNPAYRAGNGQPQFLFERNVNLSNSTSGSMVVSGPLQGLAFGPGGSTYQFVYGTAVANPYMVGGTTNMPRVDVMSLENQERRGNLLGRVEYELTPGVTAFVQGSWAQSHLRSNSSNLFMPGSGPTIRIDNPYLPASVVAQMRAAGVTTLATGTQLGDFHPIVGDLFRVVNRFTAGVNGDFEAFGRDWAWDVTYLYNKSRSRTYAEHNLNRANFALATDAVRSPSGQIVCRSSLTNPGNGCVPLNILGTGVATPEAVQYVTGTAFQRLVQKQEVFEANIGGVLFDNWAGPVSVAANLAHRTESADTATNTATQMWLLANMGAMVGKYSVKEAAIETEFPLLADAGFVRDWSFNGGFRLTDYSTSGSVSTWKVGTTLSTGFGVKLRGTLSRDIRAPGINELYSVNSTSRSALTDPFTNTTPTVVTFLQGNPNLTPEKAKQHSFGLVFQPDFLPGFQASIDYWSINMSDAIISLSGQNVVNLCFQGAAEFCSAITRENGAIVGIQGGAYNAASNRTRGIDFEASYTMPLENLVSSWGGELRLHANVTDYLEAYVNTGVAPPIDNVGTVGQLSKWRYAVSANYRLDGLTAALTVRGFSGGTIAPGAIECTSGCPTSTVVSPTYSNAHLPGAAYLDGNIAYAFNRDTDQEWQVYFNVRNILNKDPAPYSNQTYYTANTLSNVYDYLGRVYRLGVRLRM